MKQLLLRLFAGDVEAYIYRLDPLITHVEVEEVDLEEEEETT